MDIGIYLGLGVGNKWKDLSKDMFGVLVIVIGVLMVVDVVMIVSDMVDYILKYFGREMKDNRLLRLFVLVGMMFGKKKVFIEEDFFD